MPNDLVEVSNLTKTYGESETIRPVDDITFSLPANSYTAIMGPSGSGKSSLLNLIGGLDTPTAGSVRVAGQAISSLPDRARTRFRGRQIGFVFQSFNLLPRLTALENLALKLVFQGTSTARSREMALQGLAAVGLADRAEHRPPQLSGGEKQRVALARALLNEPALILADEPTGNLDTETSQRILALFDRLHEAGNSLLVVTHSSDVAGRAERIIEYRDGGVDRIVTTAHDSIAEEPLHR